MNANKIACCRLQSDTSSQAVCSHAMYRSVHISQNIIYDDIVLMPYIEFCNSLMA